MCLRLLILSGSRKQRWLQQRTPSMSKKTILKGKGNSSADGVVSSGSVDMADGESQGALSIAASRQQVLARAGSLAVQRPTRSRDRLHVQLGASAASLCARPTPYA
eukprot:6173151-Pleurochrysis_carterae.AAC.3